MTHSQPPAREFGDHSLHVMHSISIRLVSGMAAVTSLVWVGNRHASLRKILRFLELLWACTGMTVRPFKTFTSLEKP